jgi:cell division protein FtsW (lipid II flippase)
MLLSHVTLFIELNNVNNVNDVQAITNMKPQLLNLGLVEPSEVFTLILLLKNNKDDLSTTTVLAFLFLFIVFFLKTKVKNKKGLFIFAKTIFIFSSR